MILFTRQHRTYIKQFFLAIMPIAMSKDEWARLARWSDGNREDPEVVHRRELVQYMNETSRQMTKSWPNSLEVNNYWKV